jgi:hypothetical protein
MESRGKKILMGCGIGCLVVVVACIGSCVTFVYWLNRPGELLEPELLVGNDTTGYAAWTLRLEDPGTREFTETLINTMQDHGRRDSDVKLPTVVNDWLAGFQRKQNRKDIEEMFPLVVAWTQRPGAGPGEDLNLFTVSIVNAGNRMVLADWIMGFILSRATDSDLNLVEYRNENIYHLSPSQDQRLAAFIRGNDLFFTSDIDTARLAVDHLLEPSESNTAPYELRDLYDRVPADTPMRVAVTNHDGALGRIMDFLGGELPPDRILGMTVSGRFTDSQTFRATAEFLCDGPSGAADSADRLVEMLRSIQEPSGFEVEMDTAVEGEWIRIEMVYGDLVSQVERFLMERDNIEVRP